MPSQDMTAQIRDIYQSQLGRNPTQAELESLNQYSNTGSVPLTAMDLQQIVQGTPEYQKRQLSTFGNQYENLLGASDQRILGLAQNALTGQFAQQGRTPTGSSGYLSAYANAAANLAMSRQQHLANFYGGGYQGILGLAAGQGTQAQAYGQAQQGSTLGFSRQQQLMRQYQNLINQQNAYNRRSGLFGSIGSVAGGLIGGGLGYAFGGPAGLQFGGGIGSRLGGGIGQYSAGMPSYSAF